MRYFRKAFDNNEWKGCKLEDAEIQLILAATISKGIDTFALIDTVAQKKNASLSEERKIALFHRASPNYESIADDYIRKGVDERKAQEAQKNKAQLAGA